MPSKLFTNKTKARTMKNLQESEWQEMLSLCSYREAKFILAFQYFIYFLFSRTFLIIIYFCFIFGVAYYFVEYKKVPPIKMYSFAFILHFILFLLTDIFFINDADIDEIKKQIEETKKQIELKKYENEY
jgi:hypothetical protein